MHKRPSTLAAALALLLTTAGQPACDEEPPTWEPGGVYYSQCVSTSEPYSRKLDLLLVVDDSTAMDGFAGQLHANLPAIASSLEAMTEGLPELHLGVTTSVLGTGSAVVPGCPQTGAQGRLHTGSCTNPVGATYLVDVKPSGCEITSATSAECTAHACAEENCGHAPGTWLVTDPQTGCPRCRNYEGTLEDALLCLGDVGSGECPFSQPLEAMKQALESPLNPGFRREEAFLAILFITATDDCSAADDQLFAPETSALGPRTSFRCFEHGVTCEPDGREPGTRQSCQPRDDPDGLLTRVGDYIDFLRNLVEPQRLMVSGVMGPFDTEDTLLVELGTDGFPRLAPSCTFDASNAEATPGVRLHALLSEFNGEQDLAQWAMTPVCSADYTPSLAGAGSHINTHYSPVCFELPMQGCSDPGAAVGQPGDDQTCNDACQPRCVVTDIQRRGVPEETREPLPHCLEVCLDGLCPGNTDPTLAYAHGQPLKRDYRLPVEACWYAEYESWCPHGGTIIVARQADPPPRSFLDVCCSLIPERETRCDDGEDEDGDCLVDLEDPDCQAETP